MSKSGRSIDRNSTIDQNRTDFDPFLHPDLGEKPDGPDPGPVLAKFLAYLLKRHGGNVSLKECERDWGRTFDVEAEVKRLGRERSAYVCDAPGNTQEPVCIGIFRLRGELHVIVQDTEWAEDWAVYHKVKPPHHGEYFKLSKK